MQNKKPIRLIELLYKLIEEKDDTKGQEIFIDISTELLKTKFKVSSQDYFGDIVLIRYAQLATKQYIYSHRSEESKKELIEMIDIIKDFETL